MVKFPIQLACKRCEYEWNYHGNKTGLYNWPEYTSCPKCRTNVKIQEAKTL